MLKPAVLTCRQLTGMDASEVQFVAVHGTGTPLGDPIELGALGQALAAHARAAGQKLTLGAVKSCYGHTEGAAGLTGALLAMHSISQQVTIASTCRAARHDPLSRRVCCAR